MNNPEKKTKNNEWSRSIIRHPTPILSTCSNSQRFSSRNLAPSHTMRDAFMNWWFAFSRDVSLGSLWVDMLAPHNTLHAARSRLHSLIVWYLVSLESISNLTCFYSEVRHNLFYPLNSFLELVKSTLSFLSDISQVQSRPLKTPVDFFK